MGFKKEQSLNDWAMMLDAIYGGSQNYAKSPYEIHSHLTEVCGVFAKHLFKKNDAHEAVKFLPKIFAWSVALLKKLHPDKANIEEIILRKFPNSCPYCLSKPCVCWKGEKPTLEEHRLRDAYFQAAGNVRRSANDFQLMFRGIYGESWSPRSGGDPKGLDVLKSVFIRMVEELAEVGEALRFHHLYQENFENELSDFLAWWFALVSIVPAGDDNNLLVEDCLWQAYPGHCPDCQMVPCLCRPGPVRQLMSRPVPGHVHRFDSLTSLLNQAAYKEDIQQIGRAGMAFQCPSACVRLDVDNFKGVNDQYSHAAGDEALRHIASIIRGVVRERDKVYRVSGDEFAVLCANYTEEEAAGAMRRVCDALTKKKVRWVDSTGKVSEFIVSVSIGVAEFDDQEEIERAFERADKAAYKSKNSGKASVTRSSMVDG